ncbi:MAG TPA: thiol:disulfide interchange protein [Elusimicrobia bacterium]|nr:thiol:disulfide interchange protein [Elusimicrobiota bacterium]
MNRPAAAALSLMIAVPSLAAISREELKKALDANPDLVLESLKKAKKSSVFELVLDAQKEYQQEKAKEEELREKQDFEKSFADPLKPVVDAKTRIRGDEKAPVTIVEYSDFQCPFCSRGFQTVEEVRRKYGAKIRFVFKHLPLTNMHPEAMAAAQWMEALALQSPEKAWIFHDKMFSNQNKLGDAFYRETAKELGLNVEKAAKDKDGRAVQDKIEADIKEAKGFGFSGTPGFLVNGIPIRGAYPAAHFDTIIERLKI